MAGLQSSIGVWEVLEGSQRPSDGEGGGCWNNATGVPGDITWCIITYMRGRSAKCYNSARLVKSASQQMGIYVLHETQWWLPGQITDVLG